MVFEKLEHSDLELLESLQPEGWTDIRLDCKFYIDSDHCVLLKAVDNNQIYGIGASIHYVNSAWLAHIIVGEEFRNRGIGFRIVNELLKCYSSGEIKSFSLIATELGKAIYEKAGFRFVTEYVFMERKKAWMEQKISDHIFPFKEQHRESIYKIDQKISGENRKWLISEHLTNAWIHLEEDEVLGFYLSGLKEGPIYAVNEKAGLELMAMKYSIADKAVVPQGNHTAINFLLDNGFVKTTTKGTRMIIGDDIDWKPKMVYSRIGGNLG